MLCFQVMQPVGLLDWSLHSISTTLACWVCSTEWGFTSKIWVINLRGERYLQGVEESATQLRWKPVSIFLYIKIRNVIFKKCHGDELHHGLQKYCLNCLSEKGLCLWIYRLIVQVVFPHSASFRSEGRTAESVVYLWWSVDRIMCFCEAQSGLCYFLEPNETSFSH